MTPLLKIRRARNLSQRELSVHTGIDQALISRTERSQRTRRCPNLPGATVEQAAVLARFFGHAITETEVLYPGDYATGEPEDADAAESLAQV